MRLKTTIRFLFALLGALAGAQIASRSELTDSYSSSSTWLTYGGAVVGGALAGWLVGLAFGGLLARGIRRLELAAQRRPAGELVVGGVGLFLGFALATLAAFALVRLPFIGVYLLPVVYLALGYLFALVGARKHRQILATVGVGQRPEPTEANPRVQDERRGRKGREQRAGVLVDTSAIIDGRISPTSSGPAFSIGELIVPGLRAATSCRRSPTADPQRRARGRRGLEVVLDLRVGAITSCSTPDVDYRGLRDVDAKLVRLAHERSLAVLTTDYNLNKVARIQGVTVLNVNELANALEAGGAARREPARQGDPRGQGVGAGRRIPRRRHDDRGRGRAHLVGDTSTSRSRACCRSPTGKMIFSRVAA